LCPPHNTTLPPGRRRCSANCGHDDARLAEFQLRLALELDPSLPTAISSRLLQPTSRRRRRRVPADPQLLAQAAGVHLESEPTQQAVEALSPGRSSTVVIVHSVLNPGCQTVEARSEALTRVRRSSW
jgi:hypothetical protein